VPRNVEIKARIRNIAALRRTVAAIADGPAVLLEQEDTFFDCPSGRLKLRRFADGGGELIFYRRADADGPRESHFAKVSTPDPAALAALLDDALGAVGTVRKRRDLYWHGRTRIHLDDVEGLGQFVELEVVLDDGQTAADGQAIARELMTRLGIGDEDLVAVAYVDMLRDSRLKIED
jgi:predicted adenylyl cyclase CyaB